jgi:hypothetical protein
MGVDMLLKSILFEEDCNAGLDDDVADPVGVFLHKTTLAALRKAPGIDDARWDEPLGKTIELPAEFLTRSQARLEKASVVIRRVFANNPAACEEALELLRQGLVTAREELLAPAAA